MNDDSTPTDGTSRPAEAGYEAATEAHDEYFVLRFEPWLRGAIACLGSPSPLPTRGAIAVACCGPGRDLELLAGALPEREIVGVDSSAMMCARARRRCRRFANVRVEHAEPTRLSAHWGGQAGALLSCFGLQELDAPDEAIADWTRCLAPGGRLAVVFWPQETELDGPLSTLREILATEIQPRDGDWEPRLVEAIETAGARVFEDLVVAHAVQHPNAGVFFDAFAQSAPGRALALARGFDAIARLRASFVARMPEGPIRHEPAARRIVAERPAS